MVEWCLISYLLGALSGIWGMFFISSFIISGRESRKEEQENKSSGVKR